MNDFLIEALKQKKLEEQSKVDAEKQMTAEQFKSISDSVSQATDVLIRFFQAHKPTTHVDNFPDSISTPDITKVVDQLKKLEKSLKPVTNDNSDVISSLKDVADKIQELPEKMTHSDTVEVSNLQELKSTMDNGFKDLRKSIDALEMNPKITVPKPQVNIEKTNVTGVIKELKKVGKEVREKPITPVSVTPTNPLVRYQINDIDDASTVQYFGYTDTSNNWIIKKLDESVSPATMRVAEGTGSYSTNWTGRVGLTYTRWGG